MKFTIAQECSAILTPKTEEIKSMAQRLQNFVRMQVDKLTVLNRLRFVAGSRRTWIADKRALSVPRNKGINLSQEGETKVSKSNGEQREFGRGMNEESMLKRRNSIKRRKNDLSHFGVLIISIPSKTQRQTK